MPAKDLAAVAPVDLPNALKLSSRSNRRRRL